MKSKKELYYKIFLRYCLIAEFVVIGGFILYVLAPFFDGDYPFAIIIYFCLNILMIFSILLLYFRNPNIKMLDPKNKASKMAKKQVYSLIFFIPTIFFAYALGWIFLDYIPMPIPGFYGNIFLIGFVVWIIVYHNDFVRLFDIFDIYLKDQLYPETWPAKARQYDREWRNEKAYKSWLVQHGSEEEKEHYKKLSFENTDEARKFAFIRMKQIERESGSNKLKLF